LDDLNLFFEWCFMKYFFVFFGVLLSQVLFADVPTLEQARKCIMDHAGVMPELRDCKLKAVPSEPKDNEEEEKCDASNDKGVCFVYVKCPVNSEGVAPRFKIEAEVKFHGTLAKIPVVRDVMGCQMSNISVTELQPN
jgi:hypothetical protein